MIIRLEHRWRFNMLPWVLLNTFALWSFCGQYLSSNYLVIVAFSIHHNLSYACPVPCIFCRTKRSPRRVLSSRLKLPVRLSSSTVSCRRLRKYIVRSICFLTRTIGIESMQQLITHKRLLSAQRAICQHICIHTYIHIHTYIYIHVHTYIHIYIYTYIHTYILFF